MLVAEGWTVKIGYDPEIGAPPNWIEVMVGESPISGSLIAGREN